MKTIILIDDFIFLTACRFLGIQKLILPFDRCTVLKIINTMRLINKGFSGSRRCWKLQLQTSVQELMTVFEEDQRQLKGLPSEGCGAILQLLEIDDVRLCVALENEAVQRE